LFFTPQSYSPLVFSLDILHCLLRAVGVPLESGINLVSRMSPCGAYDTHLCLAYVILLSHTLHCNTLQHTAAHCSTLQHTATHVLRMSYSSRTHCSYHNHMSVAVCCSVLQCVAVCSSVLQCVAVCCSVLHTHLCLAYVILLSHTLLVSQSHEYPHHTHRLRKSRASRQVPSQGGGPSLALSLALQVTLLT